jgi:4-aminobutyrate aminotransferase-like enzyme
MTERVATPARTLDDPPASWPAEIAIGEASDTIAHIGPAANASTPMPLPAASPNAALREKLANLYGGEEMQESALFAVDAQGIFITDDTGREYIDCVSGTFDQPLGHKHPALIAAVKRQCDDLAYVGTPFVSRVMVDLAERLVEISPPNLTAVHLRDITGSTAIEGAIKMAQVATGQRDIITLFGSHHGQTAMTTDASGNAFRRELYPVHMPGMLHVPAPYCMRCFYGQSFPSCRLTCVDRIAQFIEYASSGSVAAMIVEPILGNGGNIVPPPGYFQGLRELCDRHGMLLIVDEVQTGLGRLGTMLATDYFDIRPHILVLGKGLGGPAPRAAILVEKDLVEMPRYQHSSTGGSSLLSAATALATIDVLQQPGFLEGVRERGAYLGAQLATLRSRFPFVMDVRGVGFMWGIEIAARDGAPNTALCRRIVDAAPSFGLILRSSRYGRGNVVKMRPPIIITRNEIDEVMQRLRALFQSVA